MFFLFVLYLKILLQLEILILIEKKIYTHDFVFVFRMKFFTVFVGKNVIVWKSLLKSINYVCT